MSQAFSALPLEDLLGAVVDAREQIAPHATLTPVVTSRTLSAAAGAPVFLKCENLQRGGAFKFRGAFNAMSRLLPDQRPGGVVAYSSGNHAQAVALVGQMLGIPVTVVMPDNSARIKLEATRSYGAHVVGCRPEDRETLAEEIRSRSHAALIPPFNHPHVIAGQGTLALEMHEQAPGLDAVLVPVGGGGLISGVAIATKALHPDCRVIGVEPESGDDAARSLRSGNLETCEGCASIADGTRTRSLGDITFPLIRRLVDEIVTVPEAAIAEAVRFLFHRTKLVVEPSGALGVAALLSGAFQASGPTGVVLSGGNADGDTMADILQRRI